MTAEARRNRASLDAWREWAESLWLAPSEPSRRGMSDDWLRAKIEERHDDLVHDGIYWAEVEQEELDSAYGRDE